MAQAIWDKHPRRNIDKLKKRLRKKWVKKLGYGWDESFRGYHGVLWFERRINKEIFNRMREEVRTKFWAESPSTADGIECENIVNVEIEWANGRRNRGTDSR
jgi:hypothetical protein